MKLTLQLDEHSYPMLMAALTLNARDKLLLSTGRFKECSEYGLRIIQARLAINLFPPEGVFQDHPNNQSAHHQSGHAAA